MSYDERRPEPRRTLITTTGVTMVFATTMLIIASLLCMYIAVKLFA